MEQTRKTGKQSIRFQLELWKQEVDERGGFHQRQNNNNKGFDDRCWELCEIENTENPKLPSTIC